MTMDNWMVSPRYSAQSFRDGTITEIDVFEDAIRGWILDYAAKLAGLNERNAGMAVMALVAGYPETIECYFTGRDSRNQSRKFFQDGMRRIFPELATVPPEALDKVYDDVRNGLYHGGMLKGSVILMPDGPAVAHSEDGLVFTINPFEFLRRVQDHFSDYVKRLRSGEPEYTNFMQYWQIRYPLPAEPDPAPTERIPLPDEIVLSTAAPRGLQKG